MFSRRSLVALAALGAAAFAGGGHQAGSTNPSVCRFGPAHGAWDLPHSNQDGTVDGYLYRPLGQVPPYHFVGSLIDVPSPCLSCIEGDIVGFLDDGVGAQPDYVVRGHYLGGWFSGEGKFEAQVFELFSTVPVGRIKGKFKDPPTSPSAIGTFQGNWRICD